MRNKFVSAGILLFILCSVACKGKTPDKIHGSLLGFISNKDSSLKSVQVDSIRYSTVDSTLYYKFFLNALSVKSESFSKMARLRTSLAQSHMNNYLTEQDQNFTEGKIKPDVEKSLEALRQNEREWDLVNDSMDLLLNAIHKTDTLKKAFYDVSFLIKARRGKEKVNENRKALLAMDDYRVVLIY